MSDVLLVSNENASLRKIQNKLLQWETETENSFAPLTKKQENIIYKLSQEQLNRNSEKSNEIENTDENDADCSFTLENIEKHSGINSSKEFSSLYLQVSSDILKKGNEIHLKYYDQIQKRNDNCLKILTQIKESLDEFQNLQKEYDFVSNKTSSLHLQSENLIQHQNKLYSIGDNINKRLYYFIQVEKLLQRLMSPTISVSSEIFVETLNNVDECIEFLETHTNYKDSSNYLIKYKQCLLKATMLIKSYITQVLLNATEQIVKSSAEFKSKGDMSSEAVFAIYYGKFQASAPKLKKITSIIEERLSKNTEYEQLHIDLINLYFSQRATVMSSGVEHALKNLTTSYNGDHCSLIRSSCSFLVNVCLDEHRLFYQFFSTASEQLTNYLEGLCTILYDILRPYIIHINHLETLAEICSILKDEMLEEHVQNHSDSLEAFGKILQQLLNDVQERLVFRTHIYLQTDIANYKPSPGDLAYPEQLEMMESIALSLRKPSLHRSDSKSSILSISSLQVVDTGAEVDLKPKIGNSPADLHGMWYPTVRRTLVCLSRLYRCVDRPIFQGLSQEALTYCIQSVTTAAQAISLRKTTIDGELFEIKHLLILREQIAPFRVDFTVKETSLDFSKMKTAAFSLLVKRKQLFVFGSNNALLEFLLEGTPQVKEHLLDSKKDVDRQLKSVCEMFIKDATALMISSLLNFIEKTKSITTGNALRMNTWASPQQISGVLQETQRTIKSKLPDLQRSMQLYLSNKDTEFILLRPIRNNIINGFVKLEQILVTNNYTTDDLLIANCPTAEQISFLLSSVNVSSEN